jgi:hypothetical protein
MHLESRSTAFNTPDSLRHLFPHHEPPIDMSSACNCIAGASRTLRAAPALRVPVQSTACRTFATASTTKPATWLRCLARSDAGASSRADVSAGRRLNGVAAQTRTFSNSTPRYKLNTIEQVRARNKGGPFNLVAGLLFVATAGGLYIYFTQEKERMARKRIADQTKGVGKPKVGGPFELVDHHGNKITHEDLQGKYTLVRTPMPTRMADTHANGASSGLLWLQPLPRHLPRRARQDGADVRQDGCAMR